MANPARVVESQYRYIQIVDTERFYSCVPLQSGGIILIKYHADADSSIEMVEVEEWSSSAGENNLSNKNETEASKPSPFEFDFTYY